MKGNYFFFLNIHIHYIIATIRNTLEITEVHIQCINTRNQHYKSALPENFKVLVTHMDYE
jgi:hypothetical protein